MERCLQRNHRKPFSNPYTQFCKHTRTHIMLKYTPSPICTCARPYEDNGTMPLTRGRCSDAAMLDPQGHAVQCAPSTIHSEAGEELGAHSDFGALPGSAVLDQCRCDVRLIGMRQRG